jgi:hypothetical protein
MILNRQQLLPQNVCAGVHAHTPSPVKKMALLLYSEVKAEKPKKQDKEDKPK